MFSGSYVALVTPFENGSVDENALRKLVNWQIEQGTEGLVPMGTTGESATATEAEHIRAIQIVVEEAAGRVPVIAGAGSNNPVEALKYAQEAEKAGADGLLCVAGYYSRPSQEGMYQHFKYVHDETNLPIIIYNIPPRTAVDIAPQTMARLSELPRVVGVKDVSLDLARISYERELINKEFSYFSGEDMTTLAYYAMGGNGGISVTANVAPKLCAEMHKACRAGDYQKALAIHEKLVPLHQAIFTEPNPSGAKYALSLLGIGSEEVRLPMLPISDENKQRIRTVLQQLELLS